MTKVSDGKNTGTIYSILLIISFGHFLNDMIQSVIPSVYPILRDEYNLSFLQIGIITFVVQMTSSIMQPIVGAYTDRHPHPYSLTAGMMFTLAGILLLSVASSFGLI
ncbi:MAG: MFS transporter, partial [Muribaculaceae bacterium]|nr:MFS transporter [Muribaculaceae bacterium]